MNKGIIIALAYPDVFVKATEGSYNRFLSWIGIVNNGLVRAGHAAALYITQDGTILYGDFGRYITPEFKGRCRTHLTDPDVAISLRAKFDVSGRLDNLDEIVEYLLDHPELTHGEGLLYLGVHYNVDVQTAWLKARMLSLKGSIDYGPFTLKGTNCSRFVWNALWRSRKGLIFKLRMLYRSLPSTMPLDSVMLANPEDRFIGLRSGLISYSIDKWSMWMRLFEKPKSANFLHINKSSLYNGRGTYLGGVGAGSWFSIDRYNESQLFITRRSERGKVLFSNWYQRPQDLDLMRPYRFIFDCNAHFCTIQQGYRKFRVEKSLSEGIGKDAQINQSQA